MTKSRGILPPRQKCGETFEAWDEVDVTFVTARKPKEKP